MQPRPKHAVVWASINAVTTRDLFHEMQRHNYLFVPARSVYLTERFEGFPKDVRRRLRNDLRLP